MIEKTNAYRTSDGVTHPNLEVAQTHAIASLMPTTSKLTSEDVSALAGFLLEQKDKLLAILKLKARKPKAAKPKTPKAPKVTTAK